MANVQPIVQITLNPLQPVPELCAVIAAVLPYHPGHEDAILKGLVESIEQHRATLIKEVDTVG